MLTIETIKRVIERHGFTFTYEDCLDVLADSYEGETVAGALVDYLDAYVGVANNTRQAIFNDPEAEATQ
jgi:hypothetical protein